jgi:hypothetical protein
MSTTIPDLPDDDVGAALRRNREAMRAETAKLDLNAADEAASNGARALLSAIFAPYRPTTPEEKP